MKNPPVPMREHYFMKPSSFGLDHFFLFQFKRLLTEQPEDWVATASTLASSGKAFDATQAMKRVMELRVAAEEARINEALRLIEKANFKTLEHALQALKPRLEDAHPLLLILGSHLEQKRNEDSAAHQELKRAADDEKEQLNQIEEKLGRAAPPFSKQQPATIQNVLFWLTGEKNPRWQAVEACFLEFIRMHHERRSSGSGLSLEEENGQRLRDYDYKAPKDEASVTKAQEKYERYNQNYDSAHSFIWLYNSFLPFWDAQKKHFIAELPKEQESKKKREARGSKGGQSRIYGRAEKAINAFLQFSNKDVSADKLGDWSPKSIGVNPARTKDLLWVLLHGVAFSVRLAEIKKNLKELDWNLNEPKIEALIQEFSSFHCDLRTEVKKTSIKDNLLESGFEIKGKRLSKKNKKVRNHTDRKNRPLKHPEATRRALPSRS